jgi:hypothetical protein
VSILQRPLSGTLYDPLYPASAGRGKGESEFHTLALIHLRQALEDLFVARKLDDAYVTSQLSLYYRQDDPAAECDPDLMVVLGAGKRFRDSFRVWEEGRLPDVVFEIVSETTFEEDIGARWRLWERLGVREYFLFDPEDRLLIPRLQGFRLADGVFQQIEERIVRSLESAVLNVRLEPRGYLLRTIDLATGQMVLTRLERIEQTRRVKDAEDRSRAAQERAEKLQAEIDRLKAQLNPPPNIP